MSAEQENFEQLRKLLALKRHEQPPPGYFDKLPGNVIARIEAGERSEPVWGRLLPRFLSRPAFAYGFGLAACAILVLGVGHSLKNEPSPNDSQSVAVDTFKAAAAENSQIAVTHTEPVSLTNDSASSTNPIINQPLFQPEIHVLPANYSGQNH